MEFIPAIQGWFNIKKSISGWKQKYIPVIPTAWEAKAGGFQVQVQPQHLSQRPCLGDKALLVSIPSTINKQPI